MSGLRTIWTQLPMLLLVSLSASAQNTTLIEFEIEDQFEQTYRSSDYEGRILAETIILARA